jgi:hypothetical protein
LVEARQTLKLFPNTVGQYGCAFLIRECQHIELLFPNAVDRFRREHVRIGQRADLEDAANFPRPLFLRLFGWPRFWQAHLPVNKAADSFGHLSFLSNGAISS